MKNQKENLENLKKVYSDVSVSEVYPAYFKGGFTLTLGLTLISMGMVNFLNQDMRWVSCIFLALIGIGVINDFIWLCMPVVWMSTPVKFMPLWLRGFLKSKLESGKGERV